MKESAIAIIPARGGSKRVPRKNVKEMLGKPLINYTIEAALECGVFERVLVSTDCQEIASVAEAAGAEVPFLRAATLADDVTPVSAATVDMLMRVDPEGTRYHQVCQLMANCPLRDARDVIRSHRQFTDTATRAQISVMRFGWQNPWWSMRRDEQMVLEPLFPDAMKARSQDLPELFCPTGAIWWAQSRVLRDVGTFHVAGRTGWEISWQHGTDIDTEDDWAMAIALLEMARTQQ